MGLNKNDLEKLNEIAIKENDEFFKRNPHLENAYHNSLIAICLCQGAASHYINPTVGINDFDIWYFYVKDGSIILNSRTEPEKVLKMVIKAKKLIFLERVPTRFVRKVLIRP